jgi:flavin reductase (DIM6/NTAB) family NADH-FMN oxidoreductase RutF
MRRVPQPVTIVTSSNTQTHPDGHPDGWHGATISSFNTVSLHPNPIISFNIRKISSTYDAIEASGKLWVHFLTQTPSAIDLADRFAQWDKPNPFQSLLLVRKDKDKDTEPNLEVPMIHNERSTPKRIAFILECEYIKDKTVAIGDHVVLFATVTEVENKTPNCVSEGSAFQPPGPCLVYAEGEYQGVTPLERSSQEGKMHDELVPQEE